ASQEVEVTQVTPSHELPKDITLNTSLTTCNIGSILAENQSCNLVYNYQPKYEGVNSTFGISVASVGRDKSVYTNTVNIPYSSRVTQNVFKGLPTDVSYNTDGLLVVKTQAVSW